MAPKDFLPWILAGAVPRDLGSNGSCPHDRVSL